MTNPASRPIKSLMVLVSAAIIFTSMGIILTTAWNAFIS